MTNHGSAQPRADRSWRYARPEIERAINRHDKLTEVAVIVEDLPRNATGKVLKFVLRDERKLLAPDASGSSTHHVDAESRNVRTNGQPLTLASDTLVRRLFVGRPLAAKPSRKTVVTSAAICSVE